jgi:hypothetical protein
MAPRDDDEFAVEIGALGNERLKWTVLGLYMRRINHAVRPLALPPEAFAFPPPLPAPSGHLPPYYDSLLARVQRLTAEAVTEFGEITGALGRVAEFYERGDDESAMNDTVTIYGS